MIKYLFFGLFDVLIKGKLDIKPNTSYLSDLVEFSKEKNIEVYLITGLSKEQSEIVLKETGIDSYFKKENIIDISNDYYESLNEIDRELKKQAKEKEPNYADEYFKVYYFNSVFKGVKEEILFIGHDIWMDTLYLYKYSGINSILLKETLSNNNAPNLIEIKGLNVVDSNFEMIKDYLINKKEFNYDSLESYANKLLYNEIFGKSLFNSNLSVGKILDKSHSKVVLKKKEEKLWILKK